MNKQPSINDLSQPIVQQLNQIVLMSLRLRRRERQQWSATIIDAGIKHHGGSRSGKVDQ